MYVCMYVCMYVRMYVCMYVTVTGVFNQDNASCSFSMSRSPPVTPSTAPRRNASTRTTSLSTSFALLNAQSIENKWQQINTAINEYNIDVCLLTETSHTSSQDTALRRLIQQGYSCIDVPRPGATGRRTNHGGVAAVVASSMKCKVITAATQPSTFESLCFTVTGSGDTIAVFASLPPQFKTSD